MKERKKRVVSRHKNILRSWLCFVLTIALTLGNVMPIYAEETTGEPVPTNVETQDILNLDFDGEWSEFGTSIGVAAATDNIKQVTDPANAENKCLKLYCPDTSTRTTIRFSSTGLDVTGKTIVYEYKVSAISNETVCAKAKLFMDTALISDIYLRADGIRYNGSDTVLGTISANSWRTISMVVDYAAGEYTFFVDGTEHKPEDYGITNSTFDVSGTSMGIRLDKSIGHLLVDDIRIYEGTEPREEEPSTPIPSPTPAPSATPTPSPTPAPSATPTPSPTPAPSATPDPIVGSDIFTCITFEESFDVLGDVIGLSQNVAGQKEILSENDGNKYLRLKTDGTSTVGISYAANSETNGTPKYLIAECDLSIENSTNGKARIFWGRDGSTTTSTYVYAYNNSVQPNSSIDLDVDLKAGEWTYVAVAIDIDGQTYDVYINDKETPVYENVEVGNTLSPKTFTTRLEASGGSGDLLVDNLKVYEGLKPREIEYDGGVGSNIYVNRTFDETYKYSMEEIAVTRNDGSVSVETGSDGKYLKLEAGAAEPAEISYKAGTDSNYLVAQAKLMTGNMTSGNLFVGKDPEGKAFTFVSVENNVVKANGTEITTLEEGTWADIAVAINVKDKIYTVYLNGAAVSGAIDCAFTEITAVSGMETNVSSGVMLLDDLRVYDSKTPRYSWTVNDAPDTIYVKDSTVQGYLGTNRAIQLDVSTMYADSMKKVASAEFDTSEDGKVYAALEDLKFLFGEQVDVSGAVVKDGKYDILATAAANGYAYKHELEARLLVFGTADISYTETQSKEINKYLQFERPSAEKILDLFNQNVNAQDAHPRVLITQDDVDNIRSMYQAGESNIKEWGDNAIAAANTALTVPDFDYHLYGTSMDHVDEAFPMIMNLGMAYFITDDAQAKAAYVAKAKSMMNIICNLKDWNPSSYLDVGELSAILGVGYDWFYDELTEDEKAFIEKNLMEKGVGVQNKIYYGQVDDDEVYWTWWDNTNNWNAVCNGGTMLGSIAIMDVYPEICSQVVANSLHGLEFMMESYFPEGVWHEGGGYWNYALKYVALTMQTFDNVFKDDFGFLSTPGLESTGWYGLKLSGSTGINNFGDAGTAFIDNPTVLWCAKQYEDGELLAARLQEMDKMGYKGDALDMIYYDSDLLGATIELPLDTVLDSMSIISLREKWYEKGATFLGAGGAKTQSGHANLDTGAFVVDMSGERILSDLGAESYQAPGYFNGDNRYLYYRTRPEGHNVYLINPTDDIKDYGGYTAWAPAKNTPIVSTAEGAYSTIDLSQIYAEDTDSAVRGYMITDDRRNVVIRDEITFKAGTENTFYSFFHTKASVEMESKDTAVLTLNGTKYKMTIATDVEDYTFGPVAADYLFESHRMAQAANNTTEGYCKLQFYTEKASGDFNFTMKLSTYDDPAANITAADIHNVNITSWDTLIAGDGVILELPVLDMIYIDGEEVENFNSATTGYGKRLASIAETVPAVTAKAAEGLGIEITQATEFGEDTEVKVYYEDKPEIYRIYRVTITKLPKFSDIYGEFTRLPVLQTIPCEIREPQHVPDNVIDEEFTSSRFTAEGNDKWITLELAHIYTVTKLGCSFYKGDQRKYQYKLELSVDGENWTEVFNGVGSGTTTDVEYTTLETPILAKYARFTGYGSTVNKNGKRNDWNNITEFVVLGYMNVEIVEDKTDTSYKLESGDPFVVYCTGALEEVLNVEVDDEIVDASNYTLTEGSTIVTFKQAYLESLSTGMHKVSINYAGNRSADTMFEILAKGAVVTPTPTPSPVTPTPKPAEPDKDEDTNEVMDSDSKDTETSVTVSAPATRDDTNIALWGIVALSAGVGLFVLLLIRKRQNLR